MQFTFQERLELNSALVAVFDEKYDQETLRTIIIYCRNQKNYFGEISISSAGKDDSEQFSAYTAEVGNQKVDSNQEERSWKIGREDLRIGDFKITKMGNKLFLRRFWASDIGTNPSTNMPLIYEIRYNKKTFTPIFLAKIGACTVFDIDNTMLLLFLQTKHRSVIWGDTKLDGSYYGGPVGAPLITVQIRS